MIRTTRLRYGKKAGIRVLFHSITELSNLIRELSNLIRELSNLFQDELNLRAILSNSIGELFNCIERPHSIGKLCISI